MSKPKSSRNKKEKEVPIELGFLEEDDPSHSYKLRSAFFPSKFGGLPAWLDLKNIPTATDVKCGVCDQPGKFLLQVYAPMETEDSFHRTLFLFVCPNKRCCVERNSNKNLVVLRSQLRQLNDFYSDQAPDEKDKTLGELSPISFGVTMCHVCGIKSTQSCSKCGIIYYCGKDHQKLDWSGGHKDKCESANKGNYNLLMV